MYNCKLRQLSGLSLATRYTHEEDGGDPREDDEVEQNRAHPVPHLDTDGLEDLIIELKMATLGCC